jgi:hypothetical protein
LAASARIGTTTQIQGASMLGNAAAFLVLNLAPDNSPVSGIQVLVQPTGAATVFQGTSPTGTASWPFSVPNSTSFDNIYLFAQTVVLDSASPGGLLSASQGMRFRTHAL